MANTPWYHKSGIRFECQGSGRCCQSRGEYGYVFLTKKDQLRFAKGLGLTLNEFRKNYCEQVDGQWSLVSDNDGVDCIFLENNKCQHYSLRPTQCRTWPFWPEHMSAKAWKKELVSFCPGVGKGRTYSRFEIDEHLEKQKQSELELFTGD